MKRFILLSVAGILLTTVAACQVIETPISKIYSFKGIHAGVPSMPYFAYSKAGLERLNRGMEEACTPVTLAETYNIVYGLDFRKIDPGEPVWDVFYDMKPATHAFQKILKANGVRHVEHYMLTIKDSARDQGLVLFAAVYRPRLVISVPSKKYPADMQTLTPDDSDFYVPYQFDAKGRLDTVYEWAALPVKTYQRQSHQAVLFTLTANKVLEKREKKDYWSEQKKWVTGNYMAVAREQDEIYCEFLGIEQGFTSNSR